MVYSAPHQTKTLFNILKNINAQAVQIKQGLKQKSNFSILLIDISFSDFN